MLLTCIHENKILRYNRCWILQFSFMVTYGATDENVGLMQDNFTCISQVLFFKSQKSPKKIH